MAQPASAQRAAITSEAEARAVMGEIGRLIAELCAIVEEETALVRCGRLTSATRIVERKTELARAFVNQSTRVRASTRYLARQMPDLLDALRRQHEEFRARLQLNLTALATARAVSEGILRGVSNELARRTTVATYGESGRPIGSGRRAGAPIALSRSL